MAQWLKYHLVSCFHISEKTNVAMSILGCFTKFIISMTEKLHHMRHCSIPERLSVAKHLDVTFYQCIVAHIIRLATQCRVNLAKVHGNSPSKICRCEMLKSA